ncbi:MAG: hypothetical protein ABSF54_23675 [Bryobacteraceae bacterium]|jgi:hypothetical protein
MKAALRSASLPLVSPHPPAGGRGDGRGAPELAAGHRAREEELAELLAGWPAERWDATYNSLPGVRRVKSLKDPKTAASKIWERVEKLGQMVAP